MVTLLLLVHPSPLSSSRRDRGWRMMEDDRWLKIVDAWMELKMEPKMARKRRPEKNYSRRQNIENIGKKPWFPKYPAITYANSIHALNAQTDEQQWREGRRRTSPSTSRITSLQSVKSTHNKVIGSGSANLHPTISNVAACIKRSGSFISVRQYARSIANPNR